MHELQVKPWGKQHCFQWVIHCVNFGVEELHVIVAEGWECVVMNPHEGLLLLDGCKHVAFVEVFCDHDGIWGACALKKWAEWFFVIGATQMRFQVMMDVLATCSEMDFRWEVTLSAH